MSRPEPKFSVGEAVMIRHKQRPHLNCNFAKIEAVYFISKGQLYILDGVRDTECDCDLWVYFTSAHESGIPEYALQPIPKEEQNGIDAYEFIKRSTGEIA
jgi:hypothetical protein